MNMAKRQKQRSEDEDANNRLRSPVSLAWSSPGIRGGIARIAAGAQARRPRHHLPARRDRRRPEGYLSAQFRRYESPAAAEREGPGHGAPDRSRDQGIGSSDRSGFLEPAQPGD